MMLLHSALLIKDLQVIIHTRVTSYFLNLSYELLFVASIASYFLHTS